MRDLLPEGGIRGAWLLLMLAVVLAPGLGGYPVGDRYGADTTLGILRLLPIAAALWVLPRRSASGGGLERVAAWALTGAGVWAVVSLLVHSSLLTDPVLLFAMVPGALDALAGVAAFLVARTLGGEAKGRTGIAAALALGMVWTAVSVAVEYGASVPGHRASGTFFSPNFTAGLLGLCLPVAAALCLEARERIAALLWGVAAALGFGAIVATGSRSGIALAAGGLGAALLLTALQRKGKLPWGRIGALLAAFAVLAFGFRNAVLLRTASGGAQEHSGAFRSRTWDGTLAMAAANPVLGTGPGTFALRYGPYARVAWTGQAHSSYLQTAAETGFPALLAVAVASLAALGAALRGAWRGGSVLAAGIAGGLLVGVLRGFLDSESMVAGNALPLWTLAGLACATPATTRGARAAWLWAAPLLLGLGSLLASDPWPPDPARLAAAGQLEAAAKIEPTARRYFPLARRAESQGDAAGAVAWFEKARAADPNALQTLRALAEAKEKAGDAAGAVAVWKDLAARQEGLPGQVRAMPELTETWAAFAYAALARDAARRGDTAEAAAQWQKARDLIAAYTRTSPLFQEVEMRQLAGRTEAEQAARLKGRRDELRTLLAEMSRAGIDTTGLGDSLDAMNARTDQLLQPVAN